MDNLGVIDKDVPLCEIAIAQNDTPVKETFF